MKIKNEERRKCMGRQKKVTAATKKHLSKREKELREKQEKAIKVDRNLEVPEAIQDDPIAVEEFIRIRDAAEKIDLWDDLDLSVLTIYCKSYSSYLEVTRAIELNGYVVDGKHGERISPWVTAQSRYIDTIFRCSAKLGLSTTDRLKIVVPEAEAEENKFIKYIKK